MLALAIADALEPLEVATGPEPLPDVGEFDGVVYSSRPLAMRHDDGHFVLERRRETVTLSGELAAETDLVRLEALDADILEAEGRAAASRRRPGGGGDDTGLRRIDGGDARWVRGREPCGCARCTRIS